MQLYTKVKVILTILLALIISYFTYSYLKSLRDETTVVVALQDIDEHVLVKREMLKEIHITRKDKQALVQDSISTTKEVEGAVTKTKILKGKTINRTEDVIVGTKEALIEKKILNENGEINNSYFSSDNKRIITVRLDSQGAIGNKLNIGDWVDVIFTSTGDINNSLSNIIMNHIKVVEVEHLKDKNAETSQNISLLVSPQQAIDLSFAKRSGKIDLVLDPVRGENETVYPTGIKKLIEQPSTKNSN